MAESMRRGLVAALALLPAVAGLRAAPAPALRSSPAAQRLSGRLAAYSIAVPSQAGFAEASYNVAGLSQAVAPRQSEPQPAAPEDLPSQGVDQAYEDVSALDDTVNREAQISGPEFVVLAFTTLTAFMSPFLFGDKVVEVLVPTMGATSAAIGISAEFVGRSAMFNGKELAASTEQAAAEAEYLLASAERAKSVIPACVGTAVSSSFFALSAPVLVEELGKATALQLGTPIYLLFPFVSVVAAARASLAIRRCREYVNRAVAAGKKFSDQTQTFKSSPMRGLFKFLAVAAPAPIFAYFFPGPLSFKAIVCATAAASQAAYYLAAAEYQVARGVDAVSLKARAAAVADAYSNQGARSGAILPFTSSLAALSAAATAAIVEILPLVHAIPLQAILCAIFPAFGAVIASAASVSKARCEVDAAAAKAASESFEKAAAAGGSRMSVLDPVKGTVSLVTITMVTVTRTYLRTARRWITMNPGVLFLQRAVRTALGLNNLNDQTSGTTTTTGTRVRPAA